MSNVIQPEAIRQLLQAFKEDADTIEVIMDALKSFESYHASIYKLETQKFLFACGAMDAETYREEIPLLDKKRTGCHNEVLSYVNVLNRLSAQADLSLIYDGIVSEERPYRREVANAVLSFVEQIIEDRS